MAFVEKMRLQVMKNLVVTIRNVHISYEMKSPTKLGHPFSFGATLHYLEITVELVFYIKTFFKKKNNSLDRRQYQIN
jgi:hypothetical protein